MGGDIVDVLSYTLSKKYTDKKIDEQKLKVAKVESELNNYKSVMSQININQEATQKASGYGIVSLPKNAANGQVSDVTLSGNTRRNLLTENQSSVETDTTGFTTDGDVGSSISISRDTIEKAFGNASLKVVTDGSKVNQGIKVGGVKGINGKTYIGSAYVKAPSGASMELLLRIANTTTYTRISFIGTGNWQRVSAVLTLDADTTDLNLRIRTASIPQAITFYVDGLMIEDGTELREFILGGGTKSTISAMRIKSVGKNLFNKSRASKGFSLDPYNGSQLLTDRPAFCSDFIRVNSNERYYISGLLSKGYSFVAYYDKDKRFIRRNSATPRGQMLISDLQDNEKYIRITVYDNAIAPATWEDINNVLNNLQVEKGSVATAYETYRESNAYVIAKDEEGNILELRSLPNGTKDEINVTDRKLIKRIGEKSNIANGMEIDFADMAEGGTYYAWNEDGETETGIKGDTLGIDATTLIYQLANPVEIPVQVSGTLLSYPSGTVYVEPFVADAGLYNNGIIVLHQDLPIKSIEKISKIDYETGLETILDASKAVIASDKLSFTHPDLSEGDIVFFEYEYDVESTEGETEVEFYDSRYVVKDTETGKFYKWNIVVANGQPSIELVEV